MILLFKFKGGLINDKDKKFKERSKNKKLPKKVRKITKKI